jgi:hypothetical protein
MVLDHVASRMHAACLLLQQLMRDELCMHAPAACHVQPPAPARYCLPKPWPAAPCQLQQQRQVWLGLPPASICKALHASARNLTCLLLTLVQVKETALLPGYVASVSGDAVFVRFLAGVTGRAGITQLGDGFVSAPRQHYSEGQSVRAQVLQVSWGGAAGRLSGCCCCCCGAALDGLRHLASTACSWCEAACAAPLRAA